MILAKELRAAVSAISNDFILFLMTP